MAFVSDFTFNNMQRIGNDNCSIDQISIQNNLAASYMLQNYFVSDCNMTMAKQLATTQPCINYSGTRGTDICGTNIDDSSKLLIGSIQTHPKNKLDLFHRPFATVPFLGKGSVDPILESEILQGEILTNKKSIVQSSEKSHLNYHTVPLINEIKQNIQNPSLMIESVASKNWVRGGAPSRELTRDRTFYN